MQHKVQYPAWINEIVDWERPYPSPEALLELSVTLADKSVEHGGGPFGALVADERHRIVSTGWNRVVETLDSTAHAEVTALRHAEHELGLFRLDQNPGQRFTLYSSSCPCIMCYGAIWWSGLSGLYSAGTLAEAEAISFQEGPCTPELWEIMKTAKGISHVSMPDPQNRIPKIMQRYKKSGVIY